MLTTELSDADEIDAWADRWNHVARLSDALFFQSAQWVSSWWRTIEPRSRLTLLVDGPEESPTGFLALSRLRRRLHPRVPLSIAYIGLAGSGFGAADALGPVTADPESARRLVAAAATVAGNTPAVFDSVAPRHRAAFASFEGAVELTTIPRPVVDLASGSAASWSPKVEKNIRRRERRMADDGLERRWVKLSAGTTDELGHLERLHNALWRSRGRDGLFGPRRMAFFEDLARRSDPVEGPWMQLIERDGLPVAALLGLRFGTTFCSYKTGWDPDYFSHGLGIALHSASIDWARDAGLHRYDFLRGKNSHKYTLGGHDEVDTTFVLPRGPTGRWLLARDRISVRRSVNAAWSPG